MKWQAEITNYYVPLPPAQVPAFEAAIDTLARLICTHEHTALDAIPAREPWEVEDRVICLDYGEDLAPARVQPDEIPY